MGTQAKKKQVENLKYFTINRNEPDKSSLEDYYK